MLTADQRPADHVPMKIVHIVKHCGYGNGNVHVAVDLACVQAKAGDDVTFVSHGGTFEPMLTEHGVHILKLEQEQRRPLNLLYSAWRLTRYVNRIKPDVLHAHMMNSALIGYAASKLTGVPLVTTVHNSFDRHSKLMRLGRKVVAVSHAEEASLLGQGYSREQLTAVMNAPFDSPRDAFMDDGRELEIDAPCILAANGLHSRKGTADLIEACAVAFGQVPRWKLYVAGEGPDREALEAQARHLGIADRVVFLGFVPAIGRLLKRVDIFALASHADPCSLVIGEARGAGCAIVATTVGGTPEMLEFGRAGKLVPPGSPKELARQLSNLMINEVARRELRRASLQGSEIFNVQRLLVEYESVYRSAMKPQLASSVSGYGGQAEGTFTKERQGETLSW